MSSQVESSTHVSPNTVRTAIMTAVTVLCLHWISCLWTSLASLEPEGGTWFDHLRALKDPHVSDTPGKVYLWSVYWVLTTVSTCGFGDVVAYTEVEAVVMSLLLLFSMVLYSGLIANMSTFFLSSDAT